MSVQRRSLPVESGRGAGLALRPVRYPGPLAPLGVRLSPHRALHVSARWSTAGGGSCRFGGPWGRYGAAAVAVAVAGHCDAGGAGERTRCRRISTPGRRSDGRVPSWTAGFACVFGAYPAHESAPYEGVDRTEGRLGHPVPGSSSPTPPGTCSRRRAVRPGPGSGLICTSWPSPCP